MSGPQLAAQRVLEALVCFVTDRANDRTLVRNYKRGPQFHGTGGNLICVTGLGEWSTEECSGRIFRSNIWGLENFENSAFRTRSGVPVEQAMPDVRREPGVGRRSENE